MNASGTNIRFARHRRIAFRKVAVVVASVGLISATPGLFQAGASAAVSAPAAPFTECPAVGWNTSCTLLIDVTGNGNAVLQDPNATLPKDPVPGTYDGVEDTLIGVINTSGTALTQLTLSSNSEPLFGFDDDGICQDPNSTSGLRGLGGPGSTVGHCGTNVHGDDFDNAVDTTGYGGPNAYFTNISRDFKTGIVHFINAIPANGGVGYFSLEEKLDIPDFCQDTITLAPSSVSSVVGGPAQTFTATILDLGSPAPNIPVTFTVSSGPNAGAHAVVSTNTSGQAQFTDPSSSVAGTDTVQASYPDPTCTSPPTHSAVPSTMTWTKASPSITTQANPTSITVGTPTTVGDTATFQNTVSVAPTGSVSFALYSDKKCLSPTGITGSGTISTTPQGVSTASFSTSWSAPASGTYYWHASYAGDTGNNATTTTCDSANEVVAVTPGTPAITTEATPTSITVGTPTTVGDTATFLNTTAVAPTGSVTFTLYSDNACSTPTGITGTGPISTTPQAGSTAMFSTSWSAPATGTYYWRASYPGDANNIAITTACGAADEVVAVGPASPTIITQASPVSITVGTATLVGDTATFQKTTAVAPTGSVTFTLYSDNACTMSTGISGGGAISTTPQGVSTASFANGWVAPETGTYYWQAVYPGDSNNNGYTAPCAALNELIVVGPGSPAITSQASPMSTNVGVTTTVEDTATFKETTAVPPTGSVTFTLYSDSSCTAPTGITGSGGISTTAGISSAKFLATWTPGTAGTYYWRATYAGDRNNDAFATGCADPNETITALAAPPPPYAATLLTTTLSGNGTSGRKITVRPGTPVTDTASLTGANVGDAGGTVTFSVYSDASCRTFVAGAGTETVIPGEAPQSDPITLTSGGHFYWKALYSGDIRNGPSTSNCGDEVETVLGLPLDHFLCYTATSAPSAGLGFTVPAQVALNDQFSPNGFVPKIAGMDLDCNPAQKTVPKGVTPITNPNAHLACWSISAPTTKKTVVVTNQFGHATLTTGSTSQLCLPSWKGATAPPDNVAPAPPGLSHFTCYAASYAPHGGTFKPPAPVLVKDEYSAKPVRVKLGAPKLLCLPATKTVDGVTYQALNPLAHLLCFAASSTPRKSSVYDENQFGTAKVQIRKTSLLCLPSTNVVISNTG